MYSLQMFVLVPCCCWAREYHNKKMFLRLCVVCREDQMIAVIIIKAGIQFLRSDLLGSLMNRKKKLVCGLNKIPLGSQCNLL